MDFKYQEISSENWNLTGLQITFFHDYLFILYLKDGTWSPSLKYMDFKYQEVSSENLFASAKKLHLGHEG